MLKCQKYPSVFRTGFACLLGALWIFLQSPQSVRAEAWWTSNKIEETRPVIEGVEYERVLYQKPNGRPVRAHILSVTGVGSDYIFGVLGAFGVLLPPTDFARQSGAVAVVNGSYFSKKPTRAQGLVVAHNRVLYPPHAGGSLRGAVGFSPTSILFDWIGMEDVNGFRFQSDKPGWNDCHSALGAGPMLIRKGKPRTNAEMEGFNLEQFAPRTAIGQTRDGRVLLLVIDGRQSDWSEGVTLRELTEILVNRQSIDALNLDGGGSSTLVIQNQVINRPSDYALPGQPGRERSVANVIALFRK